MFTSEWHMPATFPVLAFRFGRCLTMYFLLLILLPIVLCNRCAIEQSGKRYRIQIINCSSPSYKTNDSNNNNNNNNTNNDKNDEVKEDELLNEISHEFKKIRKHFNDCKAQAEKWKNLSEIQNRIIERNQIEMERLKNQLENVQKQNNRNDKRANDAERELNDTRNRLLEMDEIHERIFEKLTVSDEKLNNCTDDFQLMKNRNKILEENARRWMRIMNALGKHLSSVIKTLNRCRSSQQTMFCGFEDDALCGFHEADTHDIWWGRSNTAVLSSGLSLIDHTCASERGFFLHVTGLSMIPGHQRGQKSLISSPYYFGTEDHCLSFYYYMIGYNVGTLNVYVSPDSRPTPKWSAYGNQGHFWTRANLDIPSSLTKSGYRIVFEIVLDQGSHADVGIDDVRIAKGLC